MEDSTQHQRNSTPWIFLSPHLDDAVLSCGGLISDLTHQGVPVQIWTICAGDPPAGMRLSAFALSLHARWGTGPDSIRVRRQEDASACLNLGAIPIHLDLPDCIYRLDPEDNTPVIDGEEDLFKPLKPGETALIGQLAVDLAARLPAGFRLAVPLGLGGHVDHRLTRSAAESLGIDLAYYADYPYAAQSGVVEEAQVPAGWQKQACPVSPRALSNWQDAVGEYRSQISTFWPGITQMRADISAFLENGGGNHLWIHARIQD